MFFAKPVFSINNSLAICSYAVGNFCFPCISRLVILFSHDLRIVFLYTALVMFLVVSFYHLSVQPLLSAHLLGGVANALGKSDFARYFSWNSAIFILYCPIVRSIAVNYLLS